MEDEYRLNRQHKTGRCIQHEIICTLEDKKGYASSDNKIDDLFKIMKCEREQNEILPKRIEDNILITDRTLLAFNTQKDLIATKY